MAQPPPTLREARVAMMLSQYRCEESRWSTLPYDVLAFVICPYLECRSVFGAIDCITADNALIRQLPALREEANARFGLMPRDMRGVLVIDTFVTAAISHNGAWISSINVMHDVAVWHTRCFNIPTSVGLVSSGKSFRLLQVLSPAGIVPGIVALLIRADDGRVHRIDCNLDAVILNTYDLGHIVPVGCVSLGFSAHQDGTVYFVSNGVPNRSGWHVRDHWMNFEAGLQLTCVDMGRNDVIYVPGSEFSRPESLTRAYNVDELALGGIDNGPCDSHQSQYITRDRRRLFVLFYADRWNEMKFGLQTDEELETLAFVQVFDMLTGTCLGPACELSDFCENRDYEPLFAEDAHGNVCIIADTTLFFINHDGVLMSAVKYGPEKDCGRRMLSVMPDGSIVIVRTSRDWSMERGTTWDGTVVHRTIISYPALLPARQSLWASAARVLTSLLWQ